MQYKPGSLVQTRNRKWIILPSPDDNLLVMKPLGGSEDEITGIYLPLRFNDDIIKTTEFPYPTKDDLGDLATAKILYNATRLSLRNASGPFRISGEAVFSSAILPNGPVNNEPQTS